MDSKLLGFSKFVRTNPRSDHFPVKRFHHVEFWCSDAASAARRFSIALGMPIVAKSDLSTGNLAHASLLLKSADLRFLFSAPYSQSITPTESLSTASIPSFDHSISRAFVSAHGIAARAIALEVVDADTAFSISIARGAIPSFPPKILADGTVISEIRLYGDVVLRYISTPASSIINDPQFLPGFEKFEEALSSTTDFGLRRLDHAVGNVPELASAVAYLKTVTGFHEFAEFSAEDVGTSESGLNSVVLANNDETVLLPLNEPVYGTKRKSQIETYLEHNEGAGVQHLALVSENIFWTLREMRRQSGIGGFELMAAPSSTYYRNLKERVGEVLNDEQMRECEELGVLVDRDDQGTLLQIFTKPVGDRPTIFMEIIQRIGCMDEDSKGQMYQKGGCGGFGKGNFSELFKSIEEYEKTLQPKQIAPLLHA